MGKENILRMLEKEENVLFVAQAFNTNVSNAKSIIKQKINITDSEFNQLYSEWIFDKFKRFIPKKKKKSINKFRNELKRNGLKVDSENKNIVIPKSMDLDELQSSLNEMIAAGFTVVRSLF